MPFARRVYRGRSAQARPCFAVRCSVSQGFSLESELVIYATVGLFVSLLPHT